MLKYASAFLCILLFSVLGLYYIMPKTSVLNNVGFNLTAPLLSHKHERLQELILAVVVCEDRVEEASTMLKSALVSTERHQPIRFIVFADEKGALAINKTLSQWQSKRTNLLTYEVRHVSFSRMGKKHEKEWRQLFKPCSSQRLFLPTLLDDVDALLYVDSDTLFMSPPIDVWNHFLQMNSSQMAAVTPEHEDFNTGWYNRFARIPYYGPLGVNTGVMLMNLTRMREFKWEEYVVSIYRQYKLYLAWGDQDIINIIFHFHPDKLYVFPCHYNYRTDHCKYMSGCHAAEKHGVAVLHGSRHVFHNGRHLAFQGIYQAFEEYELGTDLRENLISSMKTYLDKSSSTKCGQLKEVLMRNLEATVNARVL